MIAAEMFAQSHGLNVGGWIVMIGCIGLVCGLIAFCFWRLFRSHKS